MGFKGGVLAVLASCAVVIAITPSRADPPWTRAPRPLQIPAAPRQPCPNPDALGTSRDLIVGTSGGVEVGLKTYPRSLVLADHEVVLTFDDGPAPGTTPAVLDALEHECVEATFFLIGRNANARPDLVQREIKAGHSVGHHTWSHPGVTLRGLSDEAARADIAKGIAADEKAGWGAQARDPASPHVPFFRFPGFADTKPLLDWLKERNIAVFGADVWASDWNVMTPDKELQLLMSRLNKAGKGIILLHDSKQQTAKMLPLFLAELKKSHYRVVHIVPGLGGTPTDPAPLSWSSETEASLSRIMPKLLGHSRHNPKATPSSAPAATGSGGTLQESF